MGLCVALYWQGLDGPFLVDDQSQLRVVTQWLSGDASLQQVLFGNTSWLTHRSLSMGSFALNAWLASASPFAFKAGNLLVHLACAALLFHVLCLCLHRDRRLHPMAEWTAVLIAVVWLLHPLNVSTVLYAVQRMAQLAALCCLVGLWGYVAIRMRMLDGKLTERKGILLLFATTAVTLLLGIQAKQNAAVFPLLCLVVELAWFAPYRLWSTSLKWFFAATCGLPVVLALLGLALRYDQINLASIDYGFTVDQRLLTQPRVLWSYARMIMAPHTPAMGLFADDYQNSTGLFSPLSTLPAMLALVLTSVAAWRLRVRHPAIFAGWFLFLAGHAVESSFLPLEMYYEHRNYLPATGLLLAICGIVADVADRLARSGIRVDRIGRIAVVAVLCMVSLQTMGRVRVWDDALTIGYAAIEAHPDSLRANTTYGMAALEIGRPDLAHAAIEKLERRAENPAIRAQAMLFRMALDCRTRRGARLTDLSNVEALLPRDIMLSTPFLFAYLSSIQEQMGCGEIGARDIADSVARIADRATMQPAWATSVWTMRYLAGERYADAGAWQQGLEQAQLAWHPKAEPEAAQILVRVLLHQGDVRKAHEVVREAEARAKGPSDTAVLSKMKQAIATYVTSHPARPSPPSPARSLGSGK